MLNKLVSHWSLISPDDALKLQDYNRRNCPINDLSFSLYDLMFTPLVWFVKSQCEKELDQY